MKGPERKSMRWCGKEKKDESLKSICKREKSIDNISPGAFRGFLCDKTLSYGEGPSENIHLDTNAGIWYNRMQTHQTTQKKGRQEQ